MHTGLDPLVREPTSRLASPQSTGPWNVLSAVRGLEGSDVGSDPFERTPVISNQCVAVGVGSCVRVRIRVRIS